MPLGDKDIEAVLKRPDRLIRDDARITVTQALEVVYSFVQNMEVANGRQ